MSKGRETPPAASWRMDSNCDWTVMSRSNWTGGGSEGGVGKGETVE